MTHTAPAASFPRRQARTRRFSLGVPRGFVSGTDAQGPVVLFLRTRTGTDPVTGLWRLRPETGEEVCLVDARTLADAEATLPAQERARRERTREQAGGITAFDVDTGFATAVFSVSGRLHSVEVASGVVHQHAPGVAVFDPRIAPDGRHIAFHADEGVHVVAVREGAVPRCLAVEDGVAWGRAEFAAAEEMGRSRGLWWAPGGDALAVARVDERELATWWIADPSRPAAAPVPHRYPVAGGSNVAVSLWLVDPVDGTRREVLIDWADEEYLAHVGWGPGPLTVLVQSRDQRRARVLTVDGTTGATTLVREITDDAWVELVAGTPAWAGERLVTVEDVTGHGPGGSRALCLDGVVVTPAGLQVREVVHADDSGVVFHANDEDPTQLHVFAYDLPAGLRRVSGDEEGMHRAVMGRGAGAWRVEVSHALGSARPRIRAVAAADEHELEVVSEDPGLVARPRLLRLGRRRLAAALFLPSGADPTAPLPVVLDPYGGPHAQRVVRAGAAHLASQWLADQGFAVLVTDGRGSPGRGPEWERAVQGDLATPILDDQVDALHAAAEIEPRLDLARVGVRGWSFGGTLAALAVLRRPDVFRAAVAGAPVTDWRLYDTHYTERYLGEPAADAEAYRRSSLVDDSGELLLAAEWGEHPPALQLIHGLADDNVVAAHSLRLSSALLAGGRPHAFLPLSGVTHMTPQETVAENLLVGQVAFLRAALG